MHLIRIMDCNMPFPFLSFFRLSSDSLNQLCSAARSASDSDTIRTHMEKVNLNKILFGNKLNLSRYLKNLDEGLFVLIVIN